MRLRGAKVFVTGRFQAPVEALDLGTGYEVAAAAILTDKGEVPEQGPVIELLDGENLDGPWEDRVYSSGRDGPVRRLRFPLDIERNPLYWDHPSESPGASNPVWVTL
jgi:hypothetical protein